VTAFAGSEHRLRDLQADYDMYVAKPIEPQEWNNGWLGMTNT
jgi:hypothetical protein